VRPTVDVDVVVSITSRLDFAAFEDELRARGFEGDQTDGVICRWRHNPIELILDAMPARADILGFENRWQAAAIPHAVDRLLSSGRQSSNRCSRCLASEAVSPEQSLRTQRAKRESTRSFCPLFTSSRRPRKPAGEVVRLFRTTVSKKCTTC
jgi:hypothetical protein